MAVMLINCSGISFRSVSKIFLVMKISFNINLRVPSHTTVLNWVKKQGIANFRSKVFFNNQKWILIIDESIQFGNKKLLTVLAVPESKQSMGRALGYTDMVPLVLKASDSWKSDEIISEIKSCIDLNQILYVISDNGNNLISSCEKLGVRQIEDVGHKFSWIIKEAFDKQADFEQYTKELVNMRTKLTLSKNAHIVPPNQRIMSRFMNLGPLFNWGNKMVNLLEKGLLNQQEREKVSFIVEHKNFIRQTHALLGILNKVQKKLKIEGFNQETVAQCREMLKNISGSKGTLIAIMINQYFDQTLKKMEKEKTIFCSSDIIESCFGKYKSIVKANKTVGITDLCLCISSLLSQNDLELTKQAMSNIKTVHIKEWKKKNIGETLYQKRNTFFKKAG
jgi:hypothetical protein